MNRYYFLVLFDVDSCTYYFEREDFLRGGSIDSQDGDTENTNGKHQYPDKAWHINR